LPLDLVSKHNRYFCIRGSLTKLIHIIQNVTEFKPFDLNPCKRIFKFQMSFQDRNSMITWLMKVPLSFYPKNPVGRIQNIGYVKILTSWMSYYTLLCLNCPCNIHLYCTSIFQHIVGQHHKSLVDSFSFLFNHAIMLLHSKCLYYFIYRYKTSDADGPVYSH
jgi:hypothetical protein